jgi:hypothetical protein
LLALSARIVRAGLAFDQERRVPLPPLLQCRSGALAAGRSEAGFRREAGMMNRHPVDQLYELRAQAAGLRKRMEALRSAILSGACTLKGDEATARITPRRASRYTVERKPSRAVRVRRRP